MKRVRFLAVLGAIGLFAAPTPSLAQFSSDQTKAIEAIVRDYLMRRPEVLIEAIQAYEAREKLSKDHAAQAALRGERKNLDADPGDFTIGNPKGDVTVVEFFDYRCPYCKRAHAVVEALIKAEPGVRVVLKEFPILGPGSLLAARAAMAARKQGKYRDMHDALMASRGTIDDEAVARIAGEKKLDLARLKRDMADPEIEAVLRRNHELARRLNISGTPAFVIGDAIAPGAMELADMRTMVAEARAGCQSC
ncbi:MAG: DsbA family protein [Alphaproteobacteria bacterium]|nr:DsbA family protein [Alphaproteobacteria bacterium]